MFSNITLFLLNTIFTSFGTTLILRTWMQILKIPQYNPISQGLFRMSDWLVLPLRRIFNCKFIDLSLLISIWLTSLVYLILISCVIGIDSRIILPIVLINTFLIILKWTASLVLWTTILYVLVFWINPQAPTMIVLDTLLSPLFNKIRSILPNSSNFDLAPLILGLLAQLSILILIKLTTPIISVFL